MACSVRLLWRRSTTTSRCPTSRAWMTLRSEEHTSELQSRSDLVCRLLLEKKKKEDLVESPEPPTKLDNENEDYEPPTAVTTPLPTPPITVEEDEETPPIRLDNQYEDFEPPKVITAPLPRSSTRVEDEETPNLSFTSQRLYMVFVNTPAQSLIKSRVAIEFDVFPVISIGRNPENVVVVPDQEVSRKHAQLSLEAGKVILKDLQSANGTFVYDGKQFQRVNGSVEIKPNTILKFGSGTIVRLINE